MIKVSIIIPVHNSEQYLHKCINSLLEQTLKEIEIILVDDASEDSSPEILREYAERYHSKIKPLYLNKVDNMAIPTWVGSYT